ncbi:hypothetical protein ACFV9D_05575 [Streptomyces sp. NPDC059875]|uniref:hypothetical protein n=1 Tax=unclassified Streptomyces TaxID=2593676 RepID=UPI003666F9FF
MLKIQTHSPEQSPIRPPAWPRTPRPTPDRQLAALVANPLKVTVNGVAAIDNSANVAAIERHLAQLDSVEAPDGLDSASAELLTVIPLPTRPRR